MKLGLVGYQGSGKSALFELLTGVKPDPSKAHLGQLGTAVVQDPRFDQLVALFKPKKVSPARIELFDIRAFHDDLVLADLQVVSNRLGRLRKDLAKPRPDREQLQAEIAALEPIASKLEAGESVGGMEFSEIQDKATRSFSLLTRKGRLVLLNTADGTVDEALIAQIEALGQRCISAPVGLELEVQQLPPDDRETFSREMGLGEPCATKVLHALFQVTDQITFYTSDEKEVHAWLLHRGGTALEAAGTIHTDLARGFIRAEIMAVDDLVRLGSEREVKAAGLQHVEGKEYVMRDGDEIVVRFSV